MALVHNVREFQTIASGNPAASNPGLYFLDPDSFERLVNFVKEYTSENEGDADIHEMMKIGHQKGIGDTVTIKNYVGLIQIDNGEQIQIWPKVRLASGAEDADFNETKRVFLSMLRCMKEFRSKSFSSANVGIDNMNLYEIFISMFVQEVSLLVKAGIKSAYQTEEDNLQTIRGKLLVKEQVTKNIAHKERFYCQYDEFQVNRPENKLLKSTLLLLGKITTSSRNSKDITGLLNYFELVDVSKNYDSDFSMVKIDRSTKHYETALRWAKVFLKRKSFTTFTGETKSRALLFQMDKLFEAFVAKWIGTIFPDYGWNVSTQDTGYYLFDEPSSQFSLRPDIVISKGDKIVVLDTKWKRISNSQNENYGISQGDMYQMYAYAKKYDTTDINLLYPNNDEVASIDIDPFNSFDKNGDLEAKVSIEKIQLDRIEDCIKDLAIRIEGRQ